MVEIVQASFDDRALSIARRCVVRQSSILSTGSWTRIVVACRVMLNANATTLLANGTPAFWFGICDGSAGAPGQYAPPNVGSAVALRSTLSGLSFSSGAFQVAASAERQVYVTGTGASSFYQLTGSTYIGGITGSTPVRMP